MFVLILALIVFFVTNSNLCKYKFIFNLHKVFETLGIMDIFVFWNILKHGYQITQIEHFFKPSKITFVYLNTLTKPLLKNGDAILHLKDDKKSYPKQKSF